MSRTPPHPERRGRLAAPATPQEPPTMPRTFAHLRIQRPLAVIAIHATGHDTRIDRIVEIAVIRFEPASTPIPAPHPRTPPLVETPVPQFDPASTPIRFHTPVDPGRTIPPSATQAHGIGDSQVVGGPRFEAIANHLQRLLDDADLAGFDLI